MAVLVTLQKMQVAVNGTLLGLLPGTVCGDQIDCFNEGVNAAADFKWWVSLEGWVYMIDCSGTAGNLLVFVGISF